MRDGKPKIISSSSWIHLHFEFISFALLIRVFSLKSCCGNKFRTIVLSAFAIFPFFILLDYHFNWKKRKCNQSRCIEIKRNFIEWWKFLVLGNLHKFLKIFFNYLFVFFIAMNFHFLKSNKTCIATSATVWVQISNQLENQNRSFN